MTNIQYGLLGLALIVTAGPARAQFPEPPGVVIELVVTGDNGDDDGYPDSGETVEMRLTVENIGDCEPGAARPGRRSRSNPLATRFCGLNEPSLQDPVLPGPGAAVFYLGSGLPPVGAERLLGSDSSGNPRLNANPCP